MSDFLAHLILELSDLIIVSLELLVSIHVLGDRCAQ
jgi:hypothetical protein